MRRRLSLFLLTLGIPGVGSCTEHKIPVVWEGQNLVFHTEENTSDICAGTLDHADGVAGYLKDYFAAPKGAVHYFWVPTDLDDFCGGASEGCTSAQNAYSRHVFHQHELVHAVRDADNAAYEPFDEGLAEFLGDDWPPFYRLGEVEKLPKLWETEWNGDLPGDWYPLAGNFVSYLAAEYGASEIVAFDRASNWRNTWKAEQSDIESTFGSPFSTLSARYARDYPVCDQTHYRNNGFECGLPSISADLPIRLDLEMDCSDPTVLGPRRGEIWQYATVDVPESRYYSYRVQKVGGTGPGHVQFRRCGQDCYLTEVWTVLDVDVPAVEDPVDAGMGGISLCFPKGRYTFRGSVGDDDVGDILVDIEPSTIGPGCSDIDP